TFAVSLGEFVDLDHVADDLRGQGYLLQQRTYARVGRGSVPLWIFFHQANQQEVSYLAVVLRSGLAYTFEVRGTAGDHGLNPEFQDLLEAFHFLPDARQEGWSALESNDAQSAYPIFKKLVSAESADGNALYGLGLAELALGKARDAKAH